MTSSSFFKQIYLESLTPFERLTIESLNDYEVKKNENSSYINIWKKSISKNASNADFKTYCDVNNLSPSDIYLMTSEVTNTASNIDLPFWIIVLEKVLNSISLNYQNYNKNEQKPFYQFLFPFINFFSLEFKKKLKGFLPPNNNVLNQLKTVLYKDLLSIAHLTLLEEFSEFKKEKYNDLKTDNVEDFYFKKFILKNLSEKLHSLFLKYPMLARKLATKTYRYINFTTNMFKRFYADKAEIELAFNIELDRISNLSLNLGDQHNGSSTVIFEFKNSNFIVYKPTNITVTNAFNQFLNWVNKNLNEKLRSFNVVDKNEYGWLEYVHHKECENINDVKLYYHRAGILLGIAYFLNARDYHFENLIASGNCPILVDHETIIGPDITIFDKNNNSKPDRNISGTVLECLLLPAPKDKKVPPYISGFGSSVQQKQNRIVYKIKNCNKDTMAKIPEIVSENLYKLNKPKLKSKIENLIDFQTDFNDGFKRIYDLIYENKRELLSNNSPLTYFNNATIRFINRPTKVYFKILTALNHPKYLKDSILYGLKLEVLARAYNVIGNWSSILNSERGQALLGDIPVFYTDSIANQLILPNGEVVNVFEQNAIASIKNKIKKANRQDYKYQLSLIQEVLPL